MKAFLINKNLCLYSWLRKKVGKKWAIEVATTIERAILLFGREELPASNKDGISNESRGQTGSLLKESFSAGCSKMPKCKAPEILRSEAYLDVRRNDEG